MNRRERFSAWEDADLVALVKGEGPDAEAAATELFGRYQGRVYAWCRRYTRDAEQALDLAQDVLLTAFRRLATWEGRAPFGGWLFTVTHHACLRATRSRPLHRDDGIVLEDLPDPRRDPASEFENLQERRALLDLVQSTLDPLEQRAVWLRCAEKMPVEDITRVLGLKQASGARGLLQTARRKLRAARGLQDD
ncbi:MAG TPA: sigma-70 family RNA polymerase sigma factor [Candidatus Krumholzibacteria bacterium]|nr:sigma-70 family RNA polymerase sigma factor [Candidatus Krumholzibacteria bacterium]